MFSSCNLNGTQSIRDLLMPENVIWACWLLDPPRVKTCKCSDPLNRFLDFPQLIGINHQASAAADFIANECAPTNIVVQIAPYLNLEVIPALRECLAAETADFVIVIAKP